MDDNKVADKLLPYGWENPGTINKTYGYNKNDHRWKSTKTLIRMLVDIASKGGNYLLNVGPTAQGVIPQPSVERLRAMGKWLEKNGESIYGTSGSPLGRFTWGRCTAKPGKLYLHVFNWPVDGRLQVPGLKSKVKKAYLLVDKKRALCWKSTTKSKLKKRNKILIKE
jgi:alpha-L-fucosidase